MRAPGITIERLCDRLSAAQQHHLLDALRGPIRGDVTSFHRLRRKKLFERDPDERTGLYALTPEGRKVAEQVLRETDGIVREPKPRGPKPQTMIFVKVRQAKDEGALRRHNPKAGRRFKRLGEGFSRAAIGAPWIAYTDSKGEILAIAASQEEPSCR